MSQATTYIDEEAIRAKAYELWQLRGCPEGDPGDDWLQAERLLREEAAERQPSTSAVSEPASDDDVTLPSGMLVPSLDTPETPVEQPARNPSKRRGGRRR